MLAADRPRLPILISGAAGRGQPARHEHTIRTVLEPNFEPAFIYPRDLAGLLQVLTDEVRMGTTLVAVGGGDGTLHHAVNIIGDAPTTLAPIPLGSGNDFCRSLGLAPGLSTALSAIVAGTTRSIDVLQVNGARVVTVAGLGVVARSALQVSRLARPGSVARPLVRALGSFAYLGAAGARLLVEPRLARRATIRWKATPEAAWRQVGGSYFGLFLACRPTLGAGLRLPLDVEADDGRFEIVLVEKSPRLSVAFHLPRLRSGTRPPAHILTIHHATEAVVEWPDGSPILGDGEDLGEARTVEARLLPGALRVIERRD
jgi:diacylglycerol kinase (ATP)